MTLRGIMNVAPALGGSLPRGNVQFESEIVVVNVGNFPLPAFADDNNFPWCIASSVPSAGGDAGDSARAA